MKIKRFVLSALALAFLGLGQVSADTIAGPSSFAVVGGTTPVWGIQFTALDNSTLTGFDYNHNPTTW